MKLLLLLAAIAPVIVLLVYIYKKDRAEKEPAGLLVKLLLAGAVLGVLVAAAVERYLFPYLNSLCIVSDGVDLYWKSTFAAWAYPIAKYFIAVALVEEGVKWVGMVLLTKTNKNFNSVFDGIIYAVFVSLGFALAENIMYVFDYGFKTAAIRAVTAIPGHMFFAVFMGWYYSNWRIKDIADAIQTDLWRQKVIMAPRGDFSSTSDKINSLLIPVLLHGFYDYEASSGDLKGAIVFYAFLLILYIVSFRKIKRVSDVDTDHTRYAVRLLSFEYSEIGKELIEATDTFKEKYDTPYRL